MDKGMVMFRHPLLIVIIIYLFIVSTLSNVVFTNESNVKQTSIARLRSKVDIEDIINDIIRRKGLDPNDPITRYLLYYSGHVIRFRAGLIKELIGLPPYKVAFAYFDGKEWRVLPIRIYDRVIRSNLTTIYVLPKEITNNTIIEVKLPSKYPLKTDPTIKIPEFARTSECRVIELIDKRISSKTNLLVGGNTLGTTIGYLYLFIGDHLLWHTYDYLLWSAYDYSNINEFFEAVEPPAIKEYMLSLGYSEDLITSVLEEINTNPLTVGIDPNFEVKVSWVPPIPDGGGGGQPVLTPNMVELRPQPLYSMVKSDYLLTSSNREYMFNIYVVDPAVSSDVLKWKSISLTIVIGRTPSASVTRTLTIKLWTPDNKYSITRTYSIVGDEVNILQVSFLPSAYGVSYKTINVKVSIDNVDPDAQWGFRLQPMAYIWWDYEELAGKVKPVSIYPIVDSKFEVYFSPGVGERVSGLFMQPLQLLSVPSPTAFINMPIKGMIIGGGVSQSELNYIFPFKVIVDFAGISSCELVFNGLNTETQCTLSIWRKDLVVLSQKYEAIPITLTFKVNQPLPDDHDAKLSIRIWMDNPGILPTRPMYIYDIEDIRKGLEDKLLYTSTRPNNEPSIWRQQEYFTSGMVDVVMVHQGTPYSGSIYKDVHLKGYVIRLVRLNEGVSGVTNYELIIDTSTPDKVQYCFIDKTGKVTECPVIRNNILRLVEIDLQFPDSVDLGFVTWNASKFVLSGKLPKLPEIPPLISIALSKIPYVGIALNAYTVFAWSWNKIAYETGSDLVVKVENANKRIRIIWRNGMFSGNEFKGIIFIGNIYLYDVNKEIAVTVNMESGYIGTIYTWYAKT